MDIARLPWHLRYRAGRRAGSFLRRMVVQATHRHATVRFRGPVHLGPGFTLEIPDRGTLDVGPGVHFRRGFTCEIAGDGRVEIGADTIFTYDPVIQCSTSITIGARCMIGRVLVADGNHRFTDPTRSVLEQGYDFRPVTIGDETLVTTNVVVTAPIGRRSFVAANAVVSEPIPDFTLAGGTPARPLRFYGPDGYDPTTLTAPAGLGPVGS